MLGLRDVRADRHLHSAAVLVGDVETAHADGASGAAPDTEAHQEGEREGNAQPPPDDAGSRAARRRRAGRQPSWKGSEVRDPVALAPKPNDVARQTTLNQGQTGGSHVSRRKKS